MKTNIISSQRAIYIVLLCLGLSFGNVQAQIRVGQPAGSPDGSAALDVSGGPYATGSPYRGIAPPKVALTKSTSANPVTSPATGLLIYNTAAQNDVTPGYYYWEGSKWVRFNTSSSSGSARVAAAGDPIPAYTYSQAKALTTAPGTVFMLIEPGQEGLFRNANTPTSPKDTASANGTRDANGNILNSGTIMTVGGQRYKRVINDGIINVKWFGAVGQAGPTDDTPSIQRAIDYAKSIVTAYGTNIYKATVLIPPGHYRLKKTLDATRTNGLLIKGDGGRFSGSSLVGNTGGLMIDFTGSTLSGCENLFLESFGNEENPSTIGVQFALNMPTTNAAEGGTGCTIKNCIILLPDMPSANNGIGTIGLINCRAEEFAATDCRMTANIGCIFSYKNDLIDAGLPFTVSSAYTTLATGPGSMGVIDFGGQAAVHNYGKAQPALILNATNSFRFHGYISRVTTTGGGGTNEAAILVSGPVTYNLTINSTVESFAQLLRIRGQLLNSTINGVVANQINNTSSFPTGTTRHPVIDFTGGDKIQGNKFSISFGNGPAEISGRYLLYGGNGTQLLNNEIICPQWTDNTLAVNTTILNNIQNTSFKTAQPFEKKGLSANGIAYSQSISTVGWTVGNYNQIMPTGTLSNTVVYVMKIIWGQNGVDQIVQSYVFPVSGTDFNGNAQVLPVLTPTTAPITWSNVGRAINVRYKAPSSVGQTSYGLEASINKSDMNNGTLTVTISPLL